MAEFSQIAKDSITANIEDIRRRLSLDLSITNDSANEDADIFSGFQPWLTSFKNPDYTGKQKYSWYPQALVRLVEFMKEKNLIEDSNLNELDIEKYQVYLDVYNSSDEVRDFDEKKLSSKAGGAALKKYIKYIEYLLGPKEFSFSNTNGTAVSCKGFIHTVIYNFVNQMMESSRAGAPYIHTRSFTDRL